MIPAFPLIADGRLISTAFLCGNHRGRAYIATTLHQIGRAKQYSLAIPSNEGNVAAPQVYPVDGVPTIPLELCTCDPAVDLAVFRTAVPQPVPVQVPEALPRGLSVGIGEPVFVVGYPFCPIGSLLQTLSVSHVSAFGRRVIGGIPLVNEYIIQLHSHTGMSGSPVVRKDDGSLFAIVRGCLSPPSMMSFGDLPVGSDSSIAYCVSTEHLWPLLDFAKAIPE